MVDDILSLLRNADELELTVMGRKTGRSTTRPVWFVLDEDGSLLFLLPVFGPETQWYKNILKNPEVKLSVGDASMTTSASTISDGESVRHVVELFTSRYGKKDMDAYYTNLTVAAEVELRAHGNA